MKLKKAIIFMLIPLMFLSGCSIPKQIHERLIIQGIGIDKINDDYTITIQIFDTKGGPDSDEDKNITKVMSASNKTISETFDEFPKQSGRKPLYSQNLMIVVGEDTAKLGMENILDFFTRYYEFRPSVNIFISKCPAHEILNHRENGKLITAKDISILANSKDLSSSSMNSNLLDFINSIESKTTDPHASILLKENNTIKASGTAVFNNVKFSGTLSEEESKGSLLLDEKVTNLQETLFVDKIGNLTFKIMNSKCQKTVYLENNFPKFYADISADLSISEIDSLSNRELSDDDIKNITSYAENHIQNIVNKAIDKSILDYNSDIFYFAKILKNKYPSYFKSIENDYKTVLKNSDYNVNVKCKIKRFSQEDNLF